MTLTLNKRVWVLAERLHLHCYKPQVFLKLLNRHDVEYAGEIYNGFDSTKGWYTFMSEDDYTFASFMELIPTYKYLPILQEIVFDIKIIATANDNWNYYGEPIRNWYPELVDLIKLAGVQIDSGSQKLSYPEIEPVANKEDYLPDGFGDTFLDYIKKEINEGYKNHSYLSVMFLSRKILEVTVVRIFEVVFPKLKNKAYSPENHQLWYDVNHGRYHNFETLLDNLKLKSKDFHEDEELVLEFISLVRPFKDESNKHVHFDYKVPDEQYINQWRIPKIVGLARRLFRKYCNP